MPADQSSCRFCSRYGNLAGFFLLADIAVLQSDAVRILQTDKTTCFRTICFNGAFHGTAIQIQNPVCRTADKHSGSRIGSSTGVLGNLLSYSRILNRDILQGQFGRFCPRLVGAKYCTRIATCCRGNRECIHTQVLYSKVRSRLAEEPGVHTVAFIRRTFFNRKGRERIRCRPIRPVE